MDESPDSDWKHIGEIAGILGLKAAVRICDADHHSTRRELVEEEEGRGRSPGSWSGGKRQSPDRGKKLAVVPLHPMRGEADGE